MTVVTSFSMSLDGFVANLDDRVGPLFDWLFNGTVEVTPAGYPLQPRSPTKITSGSRLNVPMEVGTAVKSPEQTQFMDTGT